ncbi:glutamate synthase-related protein [Bacillus velezensis]|nr:glutamate synthase-related protein [Bacillus velezensis]
MRACHLDTCPVGVATQNPELRKNSWAILTIS